MTKPFIEHFQKHNPVNGWAFNDGHGGITTGLTKGEAQSMLAEARQQMKKEYADERRERLARI